MKIRKKYLSKVLLCWLAMSSLPFCLDHEIIAGYFSSKAYADETTIYGAGVNDKRTLGDNAGTLNISYFTLIRDLNNSGSLNIVKDTSGNSAVFLYGANITNSTDATITVNSGCFLETTGGGTITGGTLKNYGFLGAAGIFLSDENLSSTLILSNINVINYDNSTIGIMYATDGASRLQIEDAAIISGGTIENSGDIWVTQDSTLTLDGVNVTNEKASTSSRYGQTYSDGTIQTKGNTTITDGSFGSDTIEVVSGVTTLNNAAVSSGNMQIDANSTLAATQNSTINHSTIVNNGLITADKSAIQNSTITNNNTLSVINGITTMEESTINNSGGQVIIDSSGMLQTSGATSIIGGTVTNNGALDVASGTTSLNSNVINSGTLTVESTGTLNITGGTLSGNATTLYGTMNVSDGTVSNTTNISGNAAQTGTMTVNGGTVSGDIDIGNYGKLTVGSNITAGTFGTVSGGVTVENGGMLTLSGGSVSGAVQMAASANLMLDSSGTVGSLSGGGTVNLGTSTLTVGGNNGSTTFSGAITGTGGLTKIGSGTLALSGINTYTGATTVSAGILELAGGNALTDTGAVLMSAGAQLTLDNSETVGSLSGGGTVNLGTSTLAVGGNNGSTTFSGAITGTGGLTKTGSGTLALSGINTYTGATTVSAGILELAGGNAITDTGAVVMAAGAQLTLDSSETVGSLSGGGTVNLGTSTLTVGGNNGSTTFSGAITGTGGLTKKGSGTFALSGINTYTGTTTVSAGILELAGGNAISDIGGVVMASGAQLKLDNSETVGSLSGAGTVNLGTSTLTVSGNSSSTAFSGSVSGSGGLTKIGNGTLTLSGSNTYTGATTVSAGTLIVDGGSLASNTEICNDATMAVTGGIVSGNITIDAGTLNVAGGTLSGNVENLYGTMKVSGGTVSGNTHISGTAAQAATMTVTGGTISGDIDVENYGKLMVGTNVMSGASGTISGGVTVENGGMLNLSGGSVSGAVQMTNSANLILYSSGAIGSLSGAGTVNLGTSTLTTGGNNGSTTFSGSINGTGGLTKTGSGTLALSGINTYTGTTTVSAGVLELAGGNAISDTGVVVMASGVQLKLDNSETVGSLSGAGTVNLGTSTLTISGNGSSTIFSGSVSGSGGLTKSGSGTLTLSGSNTYTGATMVTAGTLIVDGGSLTSNTEICNGSTMIVNGGIVSGSTMINAGGTLNVVGGTLTVNGGTVNGKITINTGAVMDVSGGIISGLINNKGTLDVSGGTFQLYSGKATGHSLNISQLTNAATFVINTDVAKSLADTITVLGSTSAGANTIKVNYDPSFDTYESVMGTAVFATTQSKNVTFKASATESGAYRYLPIVSVSSDGLTWSITGFTIDSANGGISETGYSGLDTAVSTMTLWRTENNNLTRRLGELRSSKGKTGEWVRMYKGEQKTAGLNSREITQQYTAIQGGYDTKHETEDGTWFTGYAVGYLHANNILERGNGTGSSVTLGGYASWLGDKGHYLDIIAKQGRLRNNYSSYLNTSSTKVTGGYNNWGTSLSAEYGKRTTQRSGWYLEPQAEINLTHITPASYTTSDGTSIHNQGVTSIIGRVGMAIGREHKNNSFYFKTSLAREFNAKSSVTIEGNVLDQNIKDTWLEFDLGWNAAWGHNVSSYIEISKTASGIVNTAWQVNLGIRHSF